MITVRKTDAELLSDLKLDEIVRVFRRAREKHLRFLIDLHSAEEDRRFLRDEVLPANQVWIAEESETVTGFIAFAPGWINHLFVAPNYQNRGLGTRLLDLAKESGPAVRLWVFQVNTPAIGFYLRHGVRVILRTDGATNEARMPDALMEWRR